MQELGECGCLRSCDVRVSSWYRRERERFALKDLGFLPFSSRSRHGLIGMFVCLSRVEHLEWPSNVCVYADTFTEKERIDN